MVSPPNSSASISSSWGIIPSQHFPTNRKLSQLMSILSSVVSGLSLCCLRNVLSVKFCAYFALPNQKAFVVLFVVLFLKNWGRFDLVSERLSSAFFLQVVVLSRWCAEWHSSAFEHIANKAVRVSL